MSSFEVLASSLKQAGMRITPQRIAICKYLCETHDHPTAAMIYDHVHALYESLSLATVYNTLDTLVGLGVVNVLGHVGDNNVHFDADVSPHINLACISCHKIVDFIPLDGIDIEQEIKNRSGYKLLGARVLYYGLCPDCQTIQVREDPKSS